MCTGFYSGVTCVISCAGDEGDKKEGSRVYEDDDDDPENRYVRDPIYCSVLFFTSPDLKNNVKTMLFLGF